MFQATTGDTIRFSFGKKFGQISMDLSKIVVLLDVKMVSKSGGQIVKDTMVAVQNNIMYSAFKSKFFC